MEISGAIRDCIHVAISACVLALLPDTVMELLVAAERPGPKCVHLQRSPFRIYGSNPW